MIASTVSSTDGPFLDVALAFVTQPGEPLTIDGGTDGEGDPLPAVSVTTEATATVFVTADDGVYEQAETPFDLETASIVEITVDGTGPVTVCLSTASSNARLFHFVGDRWADVTDPGYPTDGEVCGTVVSTSPFVAAERLSVSYTHLTLPTICSV